MIQFSSGTHIGYVREKNEDNLGYIETLNGHLFVVCDGMGGYNKGELASSIAVDSIIMYFNKMEYENPIIALYKSLELANKNIISEAKKKNENIGMGTTATIVLIKNDKVYYAHIGDSRIYYFSKNKLFRITKDHSYVQGLIDKGIINETVAEKHPQKNQISKALGVSPNIEPSISNKPIIPDLGDLFLMCSDGLTALVNDKIIEQTIHKSDLNLEQKKDELINIALNAGGNDNITIQIIQYGRKITKKHKILKVSMSIVVVLIILLLTYFTNKIFFTRNNINNFVYIISEEGDTINTNNIEFEIYNYEQFKDSLLIKFPQSKTIYIYKEKNIFGFFKSKKYLFDSINKGKTSKVSNIENQNNNKKLVREQRGSKKTKEKSSKNYKEGEVKIYSIRKGDTWTLVEEKFGVHQCFIKKITENSSSYIKENNYLKENKKLTIPIKYSKLKKYNPDNYQDYQDWGKLCDKINK